MQIRRQLYSLTLKPLKMASRIAVIRTFKVNLVGTLRALGAPLQVKLQLNRVFPMQKPLHQRNESVKD